MSTQPTSIAKKHWYREDDPCPKCEGGRIKIRPRRADGKLFLGCSNFPRLDCRFQEDIPERPGYVYVLSNPGYHRNGIPVVKIGYTTNTLEASLEQIDKTGVPFEFQVHYKAMVWKAWATMRQAHIFLQDKRLNPEIVDRDFFVCSIQDAVKAVEAAVQGDIGYKAERPPELHSADDVIDPEAQQEPESDERWSTPEALRQRRRTMTPGYVYVLSNDVYHDTQAPLLKIGYTSGTPQQRADGLYHYKDRDYRGVPQRFTLEHYERFERAFDAEQRVHEALNAFRVNPRREFFSCTLTQAIDAIRAELDRETREKAQREAADQARKDAEAAQRQEAQRQEAQRQEAQRQAAQRQTPQPLEVRPAAPQINVPPQPPVQRTSGEPAIRKRRSVVSRIVIVGCVLAAVYVLVHLVNWMKPHPVPAPTPVVEKPVNLQKAKKPHGHKKKKHGLTKRHRSTASAVEPEPQDETQPPADIYQPER